MATIEQLGLREGDLGFVYMVEWRVGKTVICGLKRMDSYGEPEVDFTFQTLRLGKLGSFFVDVDVLWDSKMGLLEGVTERIYHGNNNFFGEGDDELKTDLNEAGIRLSLVMEKNIPTLRPRSNTDFPTR